MTSFKAKYLLHLAVIILISLNQACDTGIKSKGKEEGLIEFDTKGVDETHPLFGFAPATATLKFKGDKFIIEMSTMGLFNTTVIGDNKAQTLAQTVKFMNIKDACIEHYKDMLPDLKENALNLQETKEHKEIAGLKCYKVIATKVNEPNVSFDVWYTKEIGRENSNSLTPYAQLKGVLMDYRIKKMGMELHFKAKSYQKVEVADLEFEIPASMKIITKEKMVEFFASLQ